MVIIEMGMKGVLGMGTKIISTFERGPCHVGVRLTSGHDEVR